jgi:hypothetical protein
VMIGSTFSTLLRYIFKSVEMLSYARTEVGPAERNGAVRAMGQP